MKAKLKLNVADILLETANAFDAIDVSQSTERKIVTSQEKTAVISPQSLKKKSPHSITGTKDKTPEISIVKKRPHVAENLAIENHVKKLKVDSNNASPKQAILGTVVNDFSPAKLAFNCQTASSDEEREKIKSHRKDLPVFKSKNEIIQIIMKNASVIFVGDTACGKSTQIPQYVLEGGISRNKIIAVTQPRRVAAITIAERVAKEKETAVGEKVGYCVRFEDVTSAVTKIKYLTDGMLLREAIGDPLLLRYGVVILDEAHERALHTDVLFGIVKAAQCIRKEKMMPNLKIIVMSATLNFHHFSKFFDDCPVYHLRGREYKITIFNALKTHEDYVYSALVTVFKIHRENDAGDILVFCTGSEEIQSMVTEVLKTSNELIKLGHDKLLPFALYAALPSQQQKQVFLPTPKGSRKVIFSTNIAETSVTIPGVKYVIDTGMVKARTYNPKSGFDLLKVIKISKAQAEQRAGRAGREFDGQCYRLYTKQEHQNFRNFSIPEIQRCSLASVILQIVALGVHDIKVFDFLEKPSEENINSAIQQLLLLGALKEDSDINHCELTEHGKVMVNFPLDPKFSKIIICSQKFRCTDEILSIVSLLSVESLFFSPLNEREVFLKVWKKFASSEGDHIMLLNIYKGFKNSKNGKEWCHQNFVNFKSMKNVIAIRKQLSQLCVRSGIKPCSCGPDTSRIRRCLASGLFMNSAQLHNNKEYKTLSHNQKVQIHPSSCLFSSKPLCCIYTELIETSKCYMRNISVVEEDWLKEAAPAFFENKRFVGYQLQIISH